MAMTEHTHKAFDADLQELSRMIAEMGGLAEREIGNAIDALSRHDADLSQSIIAEDAKIEELIDELEDEYTIAIVTHNMQQAARVSDKTAFMYLGELIEFDETSKIFTSPSDRRTQDYITGRFG